MVRQQRAARTRATLVRAAAEEIDRSGYNGTSLNKVTHTAGISMGALTFHFASKSELADEIQSQGAHAARTVADHATTRPGPALHAVIDLTLDLAQLLEENPIVRSAARLTRERPGTTPWSSAWLPTVHNLLTQAQHDGQLHPTAPPETITALIVHLITGIETYARTRSTTAKTTSPSAATHLHNIWQLTLTGIASHPPPHTPTHPHPPHKPHPTPTEPTPQPNHPSHTTTHPLKNHPHKLKLKLKDPGHPTSESSSAATLPRSVGKADDPRSLPSRARMRNVPWQRPACNWT